MYTSSAFLSHVDFATCSIGLLLLKDGCAIAKPRDLLRAVGGTYLNGARPTWM